MKTFVTGNSRGIGLAVTKKLSSEGFEIVGGCRSDGFDIEKNFSYVVDSIGDCDVFINNAYVPTYQTMLLREIYSQWKYEDKMIINLGSCASDMALDNPDRVKEYPSEKIRQEEFIKNLNAEYCKNGFKSGYKCRVTNLKMGYVLTEFPSLYDKTLFPTLTPEYVADMIHWLITQPKGACIRELSIHSTEEPLQC